MLRLVPSLLMPVTWKVTDSPILTLARSGTSSIRVRVTGGGGGGGGGGGSRITTVALLLSPLLGSVAVTWKDPGLAPAVYSPASVMVPPVALKVTGLSFPHRIAVAVKVVLSPGLRVTEVGARVTPSADLLQLFRIRLSPALAPRFR